LIGWLIAGLSLFMRGNPMTYNIDTMTLAERVALYNSLPIADRADHYLLYLHIVLHRDFNDQYQKM
jgi:hypothetical protein